ncbi:MAG: aminotransferase class III-fold pyridoxal phosphate-dependent enzyme [Bacteroidetes bacterium]|nr:aminotransferase class III-fold pyridoxal phosphate-dependent enzyme [Bacteroidota bacterium]
MKNKIEYPSISESRKLEERAKGLIPALSQTLAKGPTQWVDGVAPKYAARGKGSKLFDVDGNEYIDLNMGIGPVILGYAFDRVDDAIKRQLDDGITFSLMHPLEVEVSEKIRGMVPNAECVRFSKTGCDVTSAAVRLARAYTGRSKILCCGYHGWHDWYISVTDRNAGIPLQLKDLTHTFEYNNIDSLIKSLDEDTACVIMEPAIFDEPKDDFLKKVREETKKNGSLLIFDEMWTGFRLAAGGAQEFFGIKPDLAAFSKAVANGMPLSVLTGREEVMRLLDREVFFFTTFGGETLSLAAASETLDIIKNENVIRHIFNQGGKLKEAYNKTAEALSMEYTQCRGYDPRTIITFNPEAGNPLLMKSLVQQEMIKRNVLWGGFHNLCYSHTDEDVMNIADAYKEVLPILNEAVLSGKIEKYLLGKPVEPVFRKTANFKKVPV